MEKKIKSLADEKVLIEDISGDICQIRDKTVNGDTMECEPGMVLIVVIIGFISSVMLTAIINRTFNVLLLGYTLTIFISSSVAIGLTFRYLYYMYMFRYYFGNMDVSSVVNKYKPEDLWMNYPGSTNTLLYNIKSNYTRSLYKFPSVSDTNISDAVTIIVGQLPEHGSLEIIKNTLLYLKEVYS